MGRSLFVCCFVTLCTGLIWWSVHTPTLIPYGAAVAIIVGILTYMTAFLDNSVVDLKVKTAGVVEDPYQPGPPQVITERGANDISPFATVTVVKLDTENFDRMVEFQPIGAADKFKWKVTGKVAIRDGDEQYVRDLLNYEPNDPKKALEQATKFLLDQMVAVITAAAQAESHTVVNSMAAAIINNAVTRTNAMVSPLRIVSATALDTQKSAEDREQDELMRKYGDYEKQYDARLQKAIATWGSANKLPDGELERIHTAAMLSSGLLRFRRDQLELLFGQNISSGRKKKGRTGP